MASWRVSDTTTDGGPIDGEAVGRFVAALLAGHVSDAATIHLESAEQLVRADAPR